MTIKAIFKDKVKVEFRSDTIIIEFLEGKRKKVDLDTDNIPELDVKLNGIKKGKADFIIRSLIEEPRDEENELIRSENTDNDKKDLTDSYAPSGLMTLTALHKSGTVAFLAILITVIGVLIYLKDRKTIIYKSRKLNLVRYHG